MIKGVHTMFYSSQPEALRAFLRDKLGFSATDASSPATLPSSSTSRATSAILQRGNEGRVNHENTKVRNRDKE